VKEECIFSKVALEPDVIVITLHEVDLVWHTQAIQ
jgi:hypothetical protein